MAHVQNRLTSLEGAPRSIDMHIGDGLKASSHPSQDSVSRHHLEGASLTPDISEVSRALGQQSNNRGPLVQMGSMRSGLSWTLTPSWNHQRSCWRSMLQAGTASCPSLEPSRTLTSASTILWRKQSYGNWTAGSRQGMLMVGSSSMTPSQKTNCRPCTACGTLNPGNCLPAFKQAGA